MTCKLSIIIPAYNAAKTIKRTINSLKISKSHEIIIIDDGSIDDTSRVVKHLKKENDNILYVYQENQGVSAARNHGLNLAKGDYIYFIDSDDYIENPDQLEYLIDNNADSDLVVFGYYLDDGEEKRKVTFNKNHSYKTPIDFNEFLINIFTKIEYRSAVWNKIYKRETLLSKNIQFISYKEVWSEDFLFNLSFIFSKPNDNIQINSSVILIHENVPNSLSNSKQQLNVEKRIIRTLNELSVITEETNSEYSWLVQFYYINFILKYSIASIIINKNNFKRFQNGLNQILVESFIFRRNSDLNIKQIMKVFNSRKKGFYHVMILYLISNQSKYILSIILWVRYKIFYRERK